MRCPARHPPIRVISRCLTAMFKMVNDQGGIAGRQINFIVYDDGYAPPRTLEQTRRLVEQDKVAFLFNHLGTPTNSAIHALREPQEGPAPVPGHRRRQMGALPKEYPWTIGCQPSYRTEAQIYAKYILENKPNAKIAHPLPERRLRQGLSDRRQGRAGRPLSFHGDGSHATKRPTRPWTARSRRCKPAAPMCCWSAASSQVRRAGDPQVYDMGWKPMFFMTNVSVSSAR